MTLPQRSMSPSRPSRPYDLAAALTGDRIPGLDFLRAVAVLLVLVDHSGVYAIGKLAIFDGGFGVEMFFVLSGFLITWMLLDEHERHGRISLPDFYVRRAARLLPVFYLYLLAGLLVLLALGRPVPWGAVASSAVYVVNYYQAFTGGLAHYLSHCWSLAVEEQFYLIWPLALSAVLARRWPVARTVVWMILGVWVIRHVWIALGGTDEYLYRSLETRMDQLAVGGLMAALMREARCRALAERLAATAWALPLLVAGMLFSINFLRGSIFMKYGVAYIVEPVLVALALPLVVARASQPGPLATLLNAPPAVAIGLVSYGMYLFHPFVIHPARHLAERLGVPYALAVVFSIAVVYACAWASYRWFESPLRSRIRQLSPAHRAPAVQERRATA